MLPLRERYLRHADAAAATYDADAAIRLRHTDDAIISPPHVAVYA